MEKALRKANKNQEARQDTQLQTHFKKKQSQLLITQTVANY